MPAPLLASSSGSNSNFIVPNGTFFVELVIFIVVLGIVAKFILPPFQRVLDERDRTVREGLSSSDEARAEAARLDAERVAVLASARSSARSLVENAAAKVDDLIAEQRARGQQEYERRVAEASGAIEGERRRLHAELMSRAESLVVEAAERIVGGGLDVSRHRQMIAAELAEADSTQIPPRSLR
ncbi:MAG TPA: F0F1 ATP synthase subunit B [Acidimicrobiales bacterium]|nr:F0F1 ATP synthase subunit B [Acidimicrobiales bacterium]